MITQRTYNPAKKNINASFILRHEHDILRVYDTLDRTDPRKVKLQNIIKKYHLSLHNNQ